MLDHALEGCATLPVPTPSQKQESGLHVAGAHWFQEYPYTFQSLSAAISSRKIVTPNIGDARPRGFVPCIGTEACYCRGNLLMYACHSRSRFALASGCFSARSRSAAIW